MKRALFVSALLAAAIISQVSSVAGQAVAPPTVTLSAEATNNYRAVLFTFTQNDLASIQGCHYNLFAAPKASDLATLPGKGLSIATFFRNEASIQVIASPLQHLVRADNGPLARRAVKIYFRTLLSCPETTNGFGETISVSIKTFPKGKVSSVKRLMKQMKFHMQYYEP